MSSLTLYFFLTLSKAVFEDVVVHSHHHVAKHVDQASIGVVGKSLIAWSPWPNPRSTASFKPRFRIVFIIPGMLNRGTTAHADQQRVGVVAKLLAQFLLQHRDGLVDLVHQAGGEFLASLVIRVANLGVMVNPGGTGKPMLVISARLTPFTAEQCFALASALRSSILAEVINHLCCCLRSFLSGMPLKGSVREGWLGMVLIEIVGRRPVTVEHHKVRCLRSNGTR